MSQDLVPPRSIFRNAFQVTRQEKILWIFGLGISISTLAFVAVFSEWMLRFNWLDFRTAYPLAAFYSLETPTSEFLTYSFLGLTGSFSVRVFSWGALIRGIDRVIKSEHPNSREALSYSLKAAPSNALLYGVMVLVIVSLGVITLLPSVFYYSIADSLTGLRIGHWLSSIFIGLLIIVALFRWLSGYSVTINRLSVIESLEWSLQLVKKSLGDVFGVLVKLLIGATLLAIVSGLVFIGVVILTLIPFFGWAMVANNGYAITSPVLAFPAIAVVLIIWSGWEVFLATVLSMLVVTAAGNRTYNTISEEFPMEKIFDLQPMAPSVPVTRSNE